MVVFWSPRQAASEITPWDLCVYALEVAKVELFHIDIETLDEWLVGNGEATTHAVLGVAIKIEGKATSLTKMAARQGFPNLLVAHMKKVLKNWVPEQRQPRTDLGLREMMIRQALGDAVSDEEIKAILTAVGKTQGPAYKDAVSEENVEQVVELVHEADQKEARELLQKQGQHKDPNRRDLLCELSSVPTLTHSLQETLSMHL